MAPYNTMKSTLILTRDTTMSTDLCYNLSPPSWSPPQMLSYTDCSYKFQNRNSLRNNNSPINENQKQNIKSSNNQITLTPLPPCGSPPLLPPPSPSKSKNCASSKNSPLPSSSWATHISATSDTESTTTTTIANDTEIVTTASEELLLRKLSKLRSNGRLDRTKSLSVRTCQTSLQEQAKSCMSNLEEDVMWDEDEIKERRPRKCKSLPPRRVSFADAHGLALSSEKIITEHQDHPPTFSTDPFSKLVEQLRNSLPKTNVEKDVQNKKIFSFTFAQPMVEYLKFKEKLERESVALENVVCRNRSLLGTIKVRNISFKKIVTVRMSFDSWKSFIDIDTCYVHNAYENDRYDTFKFNTEVPVEYDPDDKISFCIRYNTDNGEFWDNNSDRNYEMVCNDPNLLRKTDINLNQSGLLEDDDVLDDSVFY